jgi:hypothetical protein
MVLRRKKKSKAAPAGLIAGATGAAAALAGYVLRRRRRDRDAEPPSGGGGTPARDTGNAVMPDTSSDPLVDEQTNAAAAEAGAIGTQVNGVAPGDAAFPEDPAMQAVEEQSGDSEESFESGTGEAGR